MLTLSQGVAWVDVGTDDLFHGPKGASLRTPLGGKPENTIFGSTVFCRAAETDSRSHNSPVASHETPDGITQNARHLAQQYCQNLDLTLAQGDSFYAMGNLFKFSAASMSADGRNSSKRWLTPTSASGWNISRVGIVRRLSGASETPERASILHRRRWSAR